MSLTISNIEAFGYGRIQLITDEKTALVDCAISINRDEILQALKEKLGGRKLDYIFLTHSHFDHVGPLTAIRQAYPEVKVVASEKTAKVFASEGAKSFMKYMSDMLSKMYGKGESDFDPSGLYVDIVVKDGDEISLGENSFTVLETKGHTDCSISFWCKEESTLFACESIGVWYGKYPINLEICKGYKDVLASIAKMRSLGVQTLYIAHNGLFSDGSPNEYFTMAEHCMVYYKDIVCSGLAAGLSDDEICAVCKEKIFDVMAENGIELDSYDRWLVNTKAFVSFTRKEDNFD